MIIADRITQMTPSATSSLSGKIAELKAAGEDIVPFHLGEPDFDTPAVVVDSCVQALHEGKTRYSAANGILALREAVAEKLREENSLSYTPGQIVVAPGAKMALYNAMMAICNPGDEVIVPTPCWVSYVEIIKLAQGVPVLVGTNSDYSLNVAAIRDAVTPKTKAVIINTPNNPTGAVYPEESLRELGRLAVQNSFYVIADEVYERLVYDGKKHVSIAGIDPEVYANVITVNGFSKTYCMTGWRMGYAAASPEIAKAMTALQGHTISNTATFIQWSGIDALKQCEPDIEKMSEEFLRRRDRMYDRLAAMPDIVCDRPGGAFYLMPKMGAYYRRSFNGTVIRNSVDLCNFLLSEAKVATIPGAAFEFPEAIRFSYSVSMDSIDKGMDRVEASLRKLA